MSNTTAAIGRTKAFETRNILIALISGYQKFVSPLLHQLLGLKTACRSVPTCSEYAQESIRTHGAVKGVVLSVRRLINCQPFFKI